MAIYIGTIFVWEAWGITFSIVFFLTLLVCVTDKDLTMASKINTRGSRRAFHHLAHHPHAHDLCDLLPISLDLDHDLLSLCDNLRILFDF